MALISYHNHTKWSDGNATLPELIEGARRAGVTELGVSDHFAIAPAGKSFDWSVTPETLDDYVEEVLRAGEISGDLTIRLGMEVDYFPETLEETMQFLKPYPFDFLIGSVHFINEFVIDLNAGPWEKLSKGERDETWRVYWMYIAAVAQSGYFDFIGHFDLPKKFKFYPSVDLTEDALSALDAIAESDMAIEINTSGWHKPVREAYPSFFYLQEACKRNIPLLINADSHDADHVARDFDRARDAASVAGYTELVRYEKRRRFSYPLIKQPVS